MTNVTKEHCLEIISKFEPCLENKKEGALGIDGKLASAAFVGKRQLFKCLGEYCVHLHNSHRILSCCMYVVCMLFNRAFLLSIYYLLRNLQGNWYSFEDF